MVSDSAGSQRVSRCHYAHPGQMKKEGSLVFAFWTLKGGEFVLETPIKEDTQRKETLFPAVSEEIEFPAQHHCGPEWNKQPRAPVGCADSARLLWPGLQPLSPGHFLPGHLQERAAMDLLVTFPLRSGTLTLSPPFPHCTHPFSIGCGERSKSLGLPQGLFKPFGLFLTS